MIYSNALSELLLAWSLQPQSMFDILHCRKPYSLLVLNTIPPRARGTVQNEQVCEKFYNHRQITIDNEASYALFQYNL